MKMRPVATEYLIDKEGDHILAQQGGTKEYIYYRRVDGKFKEMERWYGHDNLEPFMLKVLNAKTREEKAKWSAQLQSSLDWMFYETLKKKVYDIISE